MNREMYSMSKLLGELEMLYRETAGASFNLTYSKERKRWIIYICNKRKHFEDIVPEFAVKAAIDWIKANRNVVQPSDHYSLFNKKK